MFPPYPMHPVNPSGLPPHPMLPYMPVPVFPPVAPMPVPVTPPDLNVTYDRDCTTPEEGNTSACGSDPPRNFRPGPLPYYPAPMPFWPPPATTPSPVAGFSQPPRIPTPERIPSPAPVYNPCIAQDASISISPVPSDEKPTPEQHTTPSRVGAGRVQKKLSAATLKAQRAFAMLQLIVDLLMDGTNRDIIEWISTDCLEFTIRDRKKFMVHWNKISGKQDSFMAISCMMRAVGNDKVVTRAGQKVRLITRTAAYTYRFFPDHDLPSLPMLRDDDLQRLLTKMLLSFHLHLRKNKKVAESPVFQPLIGYPVFPCFTPPILPRAVSTPEQSDPEKT
ncbi:hypothetical protein ANCDUO_10265 [Ancylostoma duodenale]|uniref:ETS domain-containing protein n=1 Tax=Ancylostoma duodenale TaxID=51022 RepID=A0A0C2CRP7_9BILA|nr:hypothetical protein ANCDUO_10265 [Ancylostoma duodenale]